MAVLALTFDIIGTVFDWFDSFSTGVVSLAQEYALSIDPAKFANDALDGCAAGVQAVLDGGPWTPPDDILRDSISSLLLEAGPMPSAVQVDDFLALWRTLDPWADVPLALYEIEKSLRMAKSDLAARPIYHHKRDPIEAHLTIVFAALAVSRWIKARTGWSIKKFVRTARFTDELPDLA